MALRFQKRIKIAPGLKLNISKTGISTTVGIKGASVNIGKNGTYANTGLTGTGLSSRTRLDKPGKQADNEPGINPSTPTSGFVAFLVGLATCIVIGLVLWAIRT